MEGPILADTQLDIGSSVVLLGESAGDCASLVSTADLNGDGVEDIVVGASTSENESSAGSVYVVYGPPTTGEWSLVSADAHLLGEHPYGNVGYSVVTGDADGDGVEDLLIPSLNTKADATSYLFYGPVSGTANLSEGDAYFGAENISFIAGALGDVDGDGYDDALVSGRDNEIWEENWYVYRGPLAGEYIRDDADMILAENEEDSCKYGEMSSAYLADLDGDEVMEIILTDSHDNSGEIYVSYGFTEGTVSMSDYSFKFVGDPNFNELAGTSLLSGDVDGDGMTDLVIGDRQARQTIDSQGALYLFYNYSFQDWL